MDPNQGNNPDPNNPPAQAPADDTGAPMGGGTPTGDTGNQPWTPPVPGPTEPVTTPEPQAPEPTPAPAAETPTEENNGGASA